MDPTPQVLQQMLGLIAEPETRDAVDRFVKTGQPLNPAALDRLNQLLMQNGYQPLPPSGAMAPAPDMPNGGPGGLNERGPGDMLPGAVPAVQGNAGSQGLGLPVGDQVNPVAPPALAPASTAPIRKDPDPLALAATKTGTPGTSGLLGGYVGARQGDPNGLKGVLGAVMKGLGLNMDRPGLFSDVVQQEVGQYLPFYMSMADPGKEAGAADAFQNMFAGGGGNPYENIANWAKGQAGKIGNLGDAKDPLFQQKTVQGLADMMDAPLNNVQKVLAQNRFDTVEQQWREASLRNPQNYIDFIREHAKNLPEYQALLPLLGQGTAVAP